MKKIFSILWALLTLPVMAQTFQVGQLQYAVISDAQHTVAVTNYESTANDGDLIFIPIGVRARVQHKAPAQGYAVDVPATVSHESVTYTVTAIGDNAFLGKYLMSKVALPASITQIGVTAFGECSGLMEVACQAQVAPHAEASAFQGVDLQNCLLTVDKMATDSYRNAEVWKEFQNFQIHTMAEGNCGESATWSYSDDGTLVISGTGVMQDYASSADVPWKDCLPNIKTVIVNGGITSVGQNAFANMGQLTSVDLPTTITSIGASAFEGCNSLEEIGLPNGITNIGNNAFRGCESLNSFTIPSGVGVLNEGLLSGCTSLTEITIPQTVTTIGDKAFEGCTALSNVTMQSPDAPSIGANTFTTYGTLNIPYRSTASYEANDYWSQFTLVEDKTDVIEEGLVDGSAYTSNVQKFVDQLTYTRTFNNTNWQALYVPFEISTDVLAEQGLQVARINDVHQYDYELDGTIDETAVEILGLKGGSTKPNTAYMIRAKETDEKTIVLNDATLYPAQENSHSVTSWDTEFTFVGTYHTISGTEMLNNEYYALGGGALHQTTSSANDLKPMRWYMRVTDREGNKKNVNEVKVFLFGEEDQETGIVTLYAQPERGEGLYDLSGRKVSGTTQKGVYIKNGKVVIRK